MPLKLQRGPINMYKPHINGRSTKCAYKSAYFGSQIGNLVFILHVADHYQSHSGILPSPSVSLTEGSPKPPSAKQIWDRIKKRMHELHPELASLPPLTYPQHRRLGGSAKELIHHFHPLSKVGKGRSSSDSLPPSAETKNGHDFLVVIHDPSSSLYSVRLPPINEDSVSLSGRMALKKLREEVHFSFK